MWIALYLGWIICLDYCETLDSWDWESLDLSCGLGPQDWSNTEAKQETKAGPALVMRTIHLIPSKCASPRDGGR